MPSSAATRRMVTAAGPSLVRIRSAAATMSRCRSVPAGRERSVSLIRRYLQMSCEPGRCGRGLRPRQVDGGDDGAPEGDRGGDPQGTAHASYEGILRDAGEAGTVDAQI